MQILAPCAGRVIPMADVPDPVFSAQTVGPGVGIEPDGGRQFVVAPADGQLLKVSPHAFILLVDGETGILVHIGINTVRLAGEGFEVLAAQGQDVRAGTPIVAWDPDAVTDPVDVAHRGGRRHGRQARLRDTRCRRRGEGRPVNC